MKNNKGFSLVELIVVIAIMAILAAVAVAGFSFYIPKAQQASDKQMIADIEDVLLYESYAGTFEEGEGGYIILSKDGIVNDIEEGSGLDVALKHAYGDDYKNTLKLAYEDWGNNYLYIGLANGGAQSVYNSTYYGVSDKLMGQVQEITNAALAILDADAEASTEKMLTLFAGPDGNQDFLNSIAKEYGYVDANGEGDVSKIGADELPNFLVLAVAADITQASNTPEEHSISQASLLVKNFALYNAYAATDAGKAEGFDTAYADFVSAISAPNAGVSDVAAAYKTLQNATSDNFNTYAQNQGAVDVKAFDSMLGGLAGASLDPNSGINAGNLSDPNFFTTGVGNNLFGAYIDSVESFVGVQLDESFANQMAEPGVVGIYFTYINSTLVINNSLPIN